MSAAHRQLRRNIRRVAGAMAGLLVALVAALIYWQVFRAEWLLNRPTNRRLAWREQRIHRGTIYDCRGVVLAQSEFVEGRQQRTYPLGAAAATVVGYQSARYGRGGLEARYQSRLSGLTAQRTWGEVVAELEGRRVHGVDVRTTLDAKLQEVAYRALAGRPGAAVALDPATGAIRCLATSPSFDPAKLEEQWKGLTVDQRHPLFNRATQGLYPPGSTFKVVTAAAALEHGLVTAAERFECAGTTKVEDYTIHCENDHAHGTLDFTRALVVSCNCTFGTVAAKLGAARLESTANRFGFGAGQLRAPDLAVQPSALLKSHQRWFTTLVAQTGFGQGQVTATPLQMALVAATVANGGRQPVAHLVNSLTSFDGSMVQQSPARSQRQVVSAETANRVAQMMAAVVQTGSTRRVFRGLGVSVAGKTGTAQNPHGRAHAWFICFAPVAQPTLAVAVVLENAGSGSKVAAPVAAQILRAHLAQPPAAGSSSDPTPPR